MSRRTASDRGVASKFEAEQLSDMSGCDSVGSDMCSRAQEGDRVDFLWRGALTSGVVVKREGVRLRIQHAAGTAWVEAADLPPSASPVVMSGAPPTPTLGEMPRAESDAGSSSDALVLAGSAAQWAAGYALAYGFTRSHRTAEDLLDMLHSLVSSRAALGAIRAARLQQGTTLKDGLLTLPPDVDQQSRTFLQRSTAYFATDFVWVVAQLASGRRPHLWAGRLAHHVIQLGANLPAFTSSAQHHVRTYLLIAMRPS